MRTKKIVKTSLNVSRPGVQLQFIYFSLSIISPFLVAISTESLGTVHLYVPNLGHLFSYVIHCLSTCIVLYLWLYGGVWMFYNTLVTEMANLILRINERKNNFVLSHLHSFNIFFHLHSFNEVIWNCSNIGLLLAYLLIIISDSVNSSLIRLKI